MSTSEDSRPRPFVLDVEEEGVELGVGRRAERPAVVVCRFEDAEVRVLEVTEPPTDSKDVYETDSGWR